MCEWTKTPPNASAWPWVCLFAAVLLAACEKSAPPPAREAQKKPTVQAHPSRSKDASDAAYDKLMSAVDQEASAEDAILEKRVDAILAQNPQMSAQDLINVPEVNEGVREFFKQLSQSPELQNKINSSIAFAAEMKDLKEPRENLSFKMDLKGYSKERTRRLITSLLSHNPDRVVDFFEKEVGEATAEFALDPNSSKSNNGISVEPKAKAP